MPVEAGASSNRVMKSTFFVWGPKHGFSGFYFRVRGYGLSIQADRQVLFSERYGHKRVIRIGRWAIEWLKRSQLPQPQCSSQDMK